jgi:DNA repair protein RadA/Sms
MKTDVIYQCENCGAESTKWSGKCGSCGEWNTLMEGKKYEKKGRYQEKRELTKPVKLLDITGRDFNYIKTGIGELDRVLGGGIVPGSLLLLAGDPGIGKSTLLLTLADKIKNVFYVSGEESVEQIKMRADRLKIKNADLELLAETDVSYICSLITEQKPELVIIDSIQTMFTAEFPSTPGSIVQVRECALKLQIVAKSLHIPIMLVGHATKDGTVAGPRTLEHLVDAVFYLEGDKFRGTRILRGIKNRFGATDEIGLFNMESEGLKEISNPSLLFLEERAAAAGSAVTATMEGSRILLLEIQALTSPTVFGYPRRTASGFDVNRLQLILAVLVNKARLPLQDKDVYVNVVGGVQIKEPSVDLAVACAIVSSLKNKILPDNLCVFGEIGLAGEIRNVPQSTKRMKEAERLGFAKKIDACNVVKVIEQLFN